MHRTQIYLSESEMNCLKKLSRKSDKSLSELIRQAVDKFYAIGRKQDFSQALSNFCGIRAHRTDLPDTQTYLRKLRSSRRLEKIMK